MRTIAPNASLYGLAVDNYKHIYAVDQVNNAIHILDKDLTYLFSYDMGREGTWSPWYIDIYKPTGMVAVTWGGTGSYGANGRTDGGGLVYWIGAKVFGLNIDRTQFSPLSMTLNSVTVNYRLFTPSATTVTVENSGGIVNTIYNAVYQGIDSGDAFTVTWNGRDSSGFPCAPGDYKIKVKSHGYYGAYSEDTEEVSVSIMPLP